MFETITWLTTNMCDLGCRYCDFKNRTIEPGINEKLSTLEMFNSWPESDKRFICLLGGDVISMDDVETFVDRMNYLELPYGFQTSCLNFKNMRKVVNKLSNLSISVDGISSDYSRYLKENYGLYWAGVALENNPGIDIHATITVDTQNIFRVPNVVSMLSSMGIWVEITMVHWKKPNFELVPNKILANGFGEKEPLIWLRDELLKMKDKGYMIHSSKEYINVIPDYSMDLNWVCSKPVNAVIDADLSMRMCLHCAGKRVRNWSIFDLKTTEWENFLADWKMDQEEMCPGCFWDCQYELDNLPDMDEVKNWFDHQG